MQEEVPSLFGAIVFQLFDLLLMQPRHKSMHLLAGSAFILKLTKSPLQLSSAEVLAALYDGLLILLHVWRIFEQVEVCFPLQIHRRYEEHGHCRRKIPDNTIEYQKRPRMINPAQKRRSRLKSKSAQGQTESDWKMKSLNRPLSGPLSARWT